MVRHTPTVSHTHSHSHHQEANTDGMGKKKKKKQAGRAAEEKEEKEEKEEEDFNQMLKEFKQDDVDQGRHAEAPPPAAVVCTRRPFQLCRHRAAILF